MSASQTVVNEAARTYSIVDNKGRRLTLRRLTALDTLRLFKAAGPVLAQNEPWLAMAGLALSVIEIDGIPVPQPATESQVEGLVDRLGEAGLAAIAERLEAERESSDTVQNLGN